ncbi:hypothetical protein CAPTEDRAFT_187713 [Capitella teleta]|uniref:Uncharacterized protein n=1 Tax=Capitella teleta TaxID=283909 RepID=R7TT51_CAPTE|nr:hypothetical protein CAPTEDRAFT_187713 [Capitella teleta]|eukprot:ELT94676.1 hypothetical protein CAPTEDRAFT_187713 [Capitella teleta]
MASTFIMEIVFGFVLICCLASPVASKHLTPEQEMEILFGRGSVKVIPEGLGQGSTLPFPSKRRKSQSLECFKEMTQIMRKSYGNPCTRLVVMPPQCVLPEFPLLFWGKVNMQENELLGEAHVFISCEDHGKLTCFPLKIDDGQSPYELSRVLAQPGCEQSMPCRDSARLPMMSLSIDNASCQS